MDIKEFQNEQLENHYDYVLNSILDNIKKHIISHPYDNSIKYDTQTSFLVGEKSKRQPIWIYREVERNYDSLVKDLKEQGIDLKRVEEYKIIKKGYFRKKEYRELEDKYYILSW